MARTDVLIVGAGPAGAACAETLRSEGFDGSIVLAGREQDPPYDRPPLSKEYLAGRKSREDLALQPAEFWSERAVDLRTRTSVMKLDTDAKVAKLAPGDELSYERCLLATGALVRRLRLDGSGLEGIHYLRAPANSDAIRAEAAEASEVVLVGGSYIACEVAATLTSAFGVRCTLVMLEDQPLSSGFGPEVGAWFAELLRARGVELVCRDSVAAFEGSGERVETVVCESGRRLPAQMVVMGTGAMPDVMLARASGLTLGETTGGIACDGLLRTSADGIWAAGDACEFDSVLSGGPARIEHWEFARAQGAFAARSMLGATEPFAEIPYFWSDLADWASLEYVGLSVPWDRSDGSADGDAFAVSYYSGDWLTGFVSVNGGGDLDAARRWIAAARPG
jgi:3-phenylpropionate/trans-cinnamate dioxygenase ferredoxin reductase subunit